MSQTRNESLADEVRARIADALSAEARHDAEQIIVHVHHSVATLTGAVRSWSDLQDAQHAASSVPGIARVDNQLALLAIACLQPRETSCIHTPLV